MALQREIAITGHRRVRTALALAAGSVMLAAGCTEPLMSERDPRSQYDQYDKARNQHAQQYLVDEYGRKTPNLRGRLGQK